MASAMPSRSDIARFSLYGEASTAIAPEFVHIETISARSSLHEWTIDPHAHPGIFQLLLMTRGAVELRTEGSAARLGPASLVALPHGSIHAFRFEPGAEGWVLSIAVSLLADPRIGALCHAAQVEGSAPRWIELAADGQAAARLSWLLADFDRALGSDRSGRLADVQVAELALILALASETLEGAEWTVVANSPRDGLVRRFGELVEQHYRSDWTIADYVAALGTTAPTLTRASREALGKSPWHFVLDRLLLEAMRSLTYSTATVSQIAASLGFSDPAYFSRFFKSRSGMTASEFRIRGTWLAA